MSADPNTIPLNQARRRIHAAAMKHVPICEYNPFEAVQTNVLGARNIIEAAIEMEVGKVIGLSTDTRNGTALPFSARIGSSSRTRPRCKRAPRVIGATSVSSGV